MKTKIGFRGVLLAGAAAAVLALGTPGARAEGPTNQQLYDMIKTLQKNQERLARENEALKGQLRKARRTVRANKKAITTTKKVVTETKKDVVLTRKAVKDSKIIMATKDDLKRARSELGTQPSQTVVTVPQNPGSFFVFGEFLYLKPVNDQLSYAFVTSTELSTLPIPADSRLESVDTDFSPGFRAGVGWNIPGSGMDVRVAFTYLKDDYKSSVTAPSGGDIGVTRIHADTGNEEADRATGEYEFKHYVLDVEFGQKLRLGSDGTVRLFGGVRVAKIETEFMASYFGDQFSAVTPAVVTDTSEMIGVGPRIGVSGKWDLPWGLFIGGNIAGSLLVGNIDVNHTERDPTSVGNDVSLKESDTAQVFPVIEAKLALGWHRKFTDRLSLYVVAGYRFQQWFNVQGTVQFPDDVTDTTLMNKRTDIGLHGPFASAKLRF